jgi:hypothetical protein
LTDDLADRELVIAHTKQLAVDDAAPRSPRSGEVCMRDDANVTTGDTCGGRG